MKRAIFDLDGTLLEDNSSYSFCHYLYKQGVFTRFDMLYCFFLYGWHHYFGLSLWGLHEKIFNRLFRGRSFDALSLYVPAFLQERLKWYAPALDKLKQFQKEGIETFIFSSSPFFLVRPIAERIGVHYVVATEYSLDNQGRLLAITNLVDGNKKREVLDSMEGESIAFSDSHLDLPLLEGAEEAVVVNPTRKLSKVATEKKWARI